MFHHTGRRGLLRMFALFAMLFCNPGTAKSAITISPATLPDWTINSAYSQTLTAFGCTGACFWSSSGNLPPGLSFSTLTGTIGGIPNQAGSFQFMITASDLLNNKGSHSYSVRINAAPAITTPSLPDGAVGGAYSQTIQVSNGTSPYTFSLVSGTLPAGLGLSASSGTISGTPTSVGPSNFTIGVIDAAQAATSRVFILTIDAPLTITTNGVLPGGSAGSAYSQTLAGSGGTPPYTWSVSSGTLPSGLSLNASTGVLSGSLSATGTFTFTVQVADSNHATASRQFAIMIAPSAQPLSITTGATLPGGAAGSSYSQTLAATGGTPPYTWAVTAGALPASISLDAASGTVSGTPTAAGSFNFTVQVTDVAKNNASKAFSLAITSNSPTLSITTVTPLPGATQGAAYSQSLTASGGKPPYTWSITTGALPTGLTLNGSSGVISGTPTTTGAFAFSVHVSDSASATADQQSTIVVVAPSSTPSLSIMGVPAASNSAAAVNFDVTLSAPYPRAVIGQVTLTFQPSGPAARDDPSIQFSTGGRTLSFTIAAGNTHATFPASTVAFQTGTVAGTITLTVSSDLPGGSASRSATVAPTAPGIQSMTVVTNNTGFQVQIAGFSNSRDLTAASFHFTAASGQILQTSDLTVDLSSPASQWYSGTSSSQFGGAFLLVVPFTVQQGASSGLASVSAQLRNTQGTSSAGSASF